MRQYEAVGISADDLMGLRDHLATLPNRIAQARHVAQFAADHPTFDARLVLAEVRHDDRKRQSGRRVSRQKSRRDVGPVFGGDGSNMRAGTSGSGKAFLTDQLWWAHVPSNGRPRMEPVIGGLDQMPGKYGTNTQFLRTPESFTGLAT